MRSLILGLGLAAIVASTGCSGAQILAIDLHDPAAAELIVHVEAIELFQYQQPNSVIAHYAGYQGRAPVPLTGASLNERVTVAVTDWAYNPQVRKLRANMLEVWYMLGDRRIARRRFPSPFQDPNAIANSIQRKREFASLHPGGRGAPPPERQHVDPRPAPRQPDPPAAPAPRRGPITTLSSELDNPTVHSYSKPLTCALNYESGPRYLRLNETPNALVELTIDVKSHGDPRNTSESTWWQIELLDERGRPLPFDMKEWVDLGGDMRHVARWRLDGSPVIFKIVSGSTAGDTIKIRFETRS